MKKFLALMLCLVMVFSMAACSSSSDEEVADDDAVVEDAGFESMTWKMGMSGGETSTWATAGYYFADLMSEMTDGAITVDIYPSDQLANGSQTDGIQQVMDGTTEMSMHSNIIYASFDDRFSVVSLPYLFATTDEADEVLDGVGGEILNEVLQEYGLVNLGLGENGFRHVSNNVNAIETPEDMDGLKIRVAGSSVLLQAYAAWGADYTTANWSEVYSGLQLGTYDGQENPIPTMLSSSIQEVQQYVTVWTGAYDCLMFTMNEDLWNSLSEELQAIVLEASAMTMEYQREINRADDAAILESWINDYGVEVHYQTAEEAAQFKALSDSVYDYYADMLLDNGMTADEVTEFLAAFGVTVELA